MAIKRYYYVSSNIDYKHRTGWSEVASALFQYSPDHPFIPFPNRSKVSLIEFRTSVLTRKSRSFSCRDSCRRGRPEVTFAINPFQLLFN